MTVVWSCNEWDQLEEVIIGNPLGARFPTADRSTLLAEFPDVALRPGLMLCNPARINGDTLPEILKQWDVIYSPPMENTDRYDACYLSKSIGSNWIDMNLLSISPDLVVVDRDQTALIKLLEKQGLDVIPLKLRHAKMLGGGFHCVTLDIRRTGTLQRYFD